MILQLPNGKVIEITLEQYLEMSDSQVQDLVGLSSGYTKEVNNPFHSMYSKKQIEDIKENLDDEFFADDEDEQAENKMDSFFYPEEDL